ncbi:MAG: hypothetical protein ACEQSA_04165 [Weeksellaceae bacterium]
MVIQLALGAFILQLAALYWISRISIRELFQVLYTFFRSDHVVFSIISFIFLPGTIIHELSHFFMAMILLLRVREIHIFPEWEGRYIKLGRVLYEKQDVFRGIIVGIAPVIVGILLLWWISTIPLPTIWFKLGIGYVIFILSSTMFSSKQDLIDIVYIIPIGIMIALIIYVLNIDVSIIFRNKAFLAGLENFLYAINGYMLLSMGIHTVMIIGMKLVQKLKHR